MVDHQHPERRLHGVKRCGGGPRDRSAAGRGGSVSLSFGGDSAGIDGGGIGWEEERGERPGPGE